MTYHRKDAPKEYYYLQPGLKLDSLVAGITSQQNERDEPAVHPFWAPFSWVTLFAAGALFWYWLIGLLLKL